MKTITLNLTEKDCQLINDALAYYPNKEDVDLGSKICRAILTKDLDEEQIAVLDAQEAVEDAKKIVAKENLMKQTELLKAKITIAMSNE